MMHWYVLRSKPLKEIFLSNQLGFHNIEAYVPLVLNRKKNNSQKSCNFFPGYIFVRIDLEKLGMSALMWMPGSNGVVCFGGEPGVVPDAFIHHLRHKVDHLNEDPQSKWARYQKGDQVKIAQGPFRGYEAVFDQYLPSSDRVRLMLKTIAEHQLKVEIPGEQLAL